MFSRTTRVQLLAFVVIALVGVSYVAVRYVGISQWLFDSGYTVKVDLADAGGIFTNAEVDYRGVPVGRVGDMRVTASGIQIDLRIDSSDKIPSNVKAIVADRSVIGEQYVQLEPQSNGGPYLADGSVIPVNHTQLPPPVSELLNSSDQLAASVPTQALNTVVNQLYDATQGIGQNLSLLLSSSNSLFARATTDLPNTIDLIQTGKNVLATQNQQSEQIKQFSSALALIGAQLQNSDGDLSTVLSQTAGAANQTSALVSQIHGPLQALLVDLLPTATAFEGNLPQLQNLLSYLPVAVGIGNKVITPAGMNVGLVPTFFDPLPCTAGYGGTPMRTGLNTAGNPPLNLQAQCTEPASQGDVRGTQNAPKGGS